MARRELHNSLRFPDKQQLPSMKVEPTTFSGKLVELRLLSAEDIPDLEKAAASTSIFKWFIDGWIILKFGVSAYVYKLLDEFEEEISVPFAVIDRASRRVVGVTRFYNFEKRSRNMEMASWYAKKFHSTGINTESKFMLLRYAFEALFCNRVQFLVDVRNEPSVNAMKRMGAVFEGNRRNDIRLYNGELRTSAVFSITKSDWETKLKTRMERLLTKDYSKRKPSRTAVSKRRKPKSK